MPESKFSLLFQKQQSFFQTGETLNIEVRLRQLKKFKEAVLRNEELIYEALYKDLHKSQFESYATEIGFVLEELSNHIRHLKKWAKPKKVKTPLTSFPATGYITYEPRGTVLIMGPWNYPLQLVLVPLVGAISAGNTVIIKPSEMSVETSRVIEKIISETFEEEYVKVVTGGAETARELLKLHFGHIFFTGSERIGRIVLESAAPKLIPVTLELGGRSPCIVDEDVDVKLTARRIMWGKLINAGQTCIAPNCLMVHEKVKDKLLPELVEAVKKFYGNDLKNSSEYPRIINRANMERLLALMEGSEIYWGGNYDVEERYFEPTITTEASFDLPVMQSEIFGPILPVMTYRNIDELMEMLGKCPNPLSLYYFSNNKKHIKKILASVPSGGVTINDTLMHFTFSSLPFGGTGSSGMGRYHGKFSFQTFSHQKPVVYRGTWLDIPVRYAPFKNKLKIFKKLIK